MQWGHTRDDETSVGAHGRAPVVFAGITGRETHEAARPFLSAVPVNQRCFHGNLRLGMVWDNARREV